MSLSASACFAKFHTSWQAMAIFVLLIIYSTTPAAGQSQIGSSHMHGQHAWWQVVVLWQGTDCLVRWQLTFFSRILYTHCILDFGMLSM